MAANFIYGAISDEARKEHDDAVLETQLILLKKIHSSTTAAGARDYAEAFALISGLIQTPMPPRS